MFTSKLSRVILSLEISQNTLSYPEIFKNFNISLVPSVRGNPNIVKKYKLVLIVGVGSTWVVFAGLISPYDLDVFLLH